MKKTEKTKSTAVATVNPVNPVNPVQNSPAAKAVPLTDDQAANAIRQQYQVVIKAEEASFWARARLGAMLLKWEEFLGEARGGKGGTSGEGLKGWLEKNCPELGYNSAISYKNSARMAVTMIGGGAVAVAALLGESEVTQPDGDIIDVPSDVIEKRDQLYKDVDSRRKLEQAYFAFMSENGRAGAPRTPKNPLPKLSQRDAAKSIWNIFMQQATRRSLRDAVPLLGEKETQTCHDDLRDLVELLKSHLKEF